MLFVKNFLKESPAYIIFIVFKVIASMISLGDTLGYNLNLTILTANVDKNLLKKWYQPYCDHCLTVRPSLFIRPLVQLSHFFYILLMT